MEFISGHATFTDDRCVEVDGTKYSAKHILIATGGYPFIPPIPGNVYHNKTYYKINFSSAVIFFYFRFQFKIYLTLERKNIYMIDPVTNLINSILKKLPNQSE